MNKYYKYLNLTINNIIKTLMIKIHFFFVKLLIVNISMVKKKKEENEKKKSVHINFIHIINIIL